MKNLLTQWELRRKTDYFIALQGVKNLRNLTRKTVEENQKMRSTS